MTRRPAARTFLRREVSSTYVSQDDRYVVSFVAGYSPERDGIGSPEEAARAALELTRDAGSPDTTWFIFDRATGEMRVLEQGEFEAPADEASPSLLSR